MKKDIRNDRKVIDDKLVYIRGINKPNNGIINYLEGLSEHLSKLEDGYNNLSDRQDAVKIELTKKENYTDKIDETKRRLEKIDKKLGVDKK